MKPNLISTLRQRPVRLLRLALVAVLALGFGMRLARLAESPMRSPDERTYLRFATRLAHEGIFATASEFREYETDQSQWNTPAPVRTGFILPVAIAMKIMDSEEMTVPVLISVISSIFALLLAVWLADRHFSRQAALATAIFMTVSLVELGLARRAWQDATFGLFTLALFALAAEIARQPDRFGLYVAFPAMGAWCLLTKQFAVISYGIAALALLLITRRYVAILTGGLAAFLAALGIWSAIGGGPALTINVFRISLTPGAGAWQYQLECCGGPWWQLPMVMWLISPLTALLALLGIFATRRDNAGRIAAVMAVGFLAFLSFYPRLQSLRFVSPVHAIYCLLAGTGAAWVIAQARRTLSRQARPAFYAVVAAIAVISMGREYRVYTEIAATGMQDLGAVPVRQTLTR